MVSILQRVERQIFSLSFAARRPLWVKSRHVRRKPSCFAYPSKAHIDPPREWAAPVMTEGNKAAHRTVLLLSDTEIAERHYADGFFAQPTESA
jgi:hypothetical protein